MYVSCNELQQRVAKGAASCNQKGESYNCTGRMIRVKEQVGCGMINIVDPMEEREKQRRHDHLQDPNTLDDGMENWSPPSPR